MNTNQTINRYNQDGSENLDYWFGVRSVRTPIEIKPMSEIKKTFDVISNKEKPQYVRYSMSELKKRSTKRLETMHNNVFGYIDNRQMMIVNLFNKLNQLWNEFIGFDILQINIPINKLWGELSSGKRGRKSKFEEAQIHEMLQMSYHGYRLVDIAEIFETNIATVSQTINGKGTYAYVVNTRLVIRASKNNRVQ